MADAALVIGWGTPGRGREQKAIQVFGESMAYWGQLQQQGAIEAAEAYLLAPHGGDLGGFAVLKGDAAKLDEVRRSDDFQRIVTRAQLIVDSLGVVPATTGQALAAQMATFTAQAAELT